MIERAPSFENNRERRIFDEIEPENDALKKNIISGVENSLYF